MATTRSSQGSAKSSPASGSKSGSKAGGKRSAEPQPSPAAKRGRPSKKAKEQKTIEETMNGTEDDKDVAEQVDGDADKQSAADSQEVDGEPMEAVESHEKKGKESEASGTEKAELKSNGLQEGEKNAFDEVKADEGEVKKAAEQELEENRENIANNDKSVVEDAERAAAIPSSILEKGIIYFVFRPRVGVENPQGVEDVARTHIFLRPLPLGAKIGEGPLEDAGNTRVLALPKKVLPQSGKDRFLVFVDNSKAAVPELKNQIAANEYATKTSG
jgi:hypothetical protein